jgi:hypothetical protein
LVLGGAPHAAAATAQNPAARSHVLIIAGVGGEAAYRDAFHKAAIDMATAASQRFGLPDSSVIVLTEEPARAPGRIAGRSTRESVEKAIATLANRAGPDDHVLLLLIGHGSQQGEEARFNVPGPDLTAADFARLLERFGPRRVVLVNTASASGGFVKALSGRNRVIITATKSGFERNETLFPRFFVQAFTADVADADKDNRLSILEAFVYARREVARAYETENRLLTEHALLDDNGDGVGSAEPDARTGDGSLARSTFLAAGRPSVAAAASNDPRLRSLLAEKQTIERQIDSLRLRKETMDATAYEQELEKLLVSLAQTNRTIREIEGRTP